MRINAARQRTPVPRQLRLLLAARAVNQLGAFSLAFLTAMLCRDFGATYATAGAVSAAFGLATIPSRLLGGRLADKIGRRRTILLGMTGCAAAQLGIAGAPSLAVAAGSAVLLGLAFELYEPPSQAMIADATAPGDRAHAFALLTTALAVGNMAAGLIAAVAGRSSLRWLFVVDAATCLGCALIVQLGLPADRRTGTPSGVASRSPGAVRDGAASRARRQSPWRDPALLAMTGTGSVFALIYMTILVGLPLTLAADGQHPASAGLLLTVATLSLVLTRPVLRIGPVARLPLSWACAGGFVLMGLGTAGYALAHSLAALMLPTAAWSIGNLLLTGRALAVVTGLAPADATARYLAVYGLRWGAAAVAAPALATYLIASFGTTSLWAGMSVVCLAMAVAEPLVLNSAASVRRPAGSPD